MDYGFRALGDLSDLGRGLGFRVLGVWIGFGQTPFPTTSLAYPRPTIFRHGLLSESFSDSLRSLAKVTWGGGGDEP